MSARKVIHTLFGVALFGVLATSSIGAMPAAGKMTVLHVQQSRAAPRRRTASRHLSLRDRQPRHERECRSRGQSRSLEGLSDADHPSGRTPAVARHGAADRARRVSGWPAAPGGVVVSPWRDDRPRVHLLIRRVSARHAGTHMLSGMASPPGRLTVSDRRPAEVYRARSARFANSS